MSTQENRTHFQTFTAEHLDTIRSQILARDGCLNIQPRRVPDAIVEMGPDAVAMFLVEPESIESLLNRYASLPTAQHLCIAMGRGRVGVGNDTARLMSHWVDHWAQAPADLLASPGLGPIRRSIQARAVEARNVLPELPPLEVIRTLWMLDPESPSGLASVRTGKALKGEFRSGSLWVTYRAAGQGKTLYPCADIVDALKGDLEGDALDLYERQELARKAQLKEEREAVTIINQHELDAINEAFPASARLPLIEARNKYNSRHCVFRTWDPVERRVVFDAPALIADARFSVGDRFAKRLETLTEQGIDLSALLCSHLRIPMTKGSLVYQDEYAKTKVRMAQEAAAKAA
ncbi:hypothetical protein ACNFIC_00705 [Pseudomonas sp. NY15463]|uniref:hypothetical protein n=1 Tax=Pseudomonas sp. NY15463 TaxID=3400361 RepID=UPI003A871D1D